MKVILASIFLSLLLCQQHVSPAEPVLVVVVQAFELHRHAVSNRRLQQRRRRIVVSNRYPSGATLDVTSYSLYRKNFRRIITSAVVGKLLASDENNNIDIDTVSFTDDDDGDDVSNTARTDNNNSNNSSSSSSNVVSSFNPFQYDASSVRMNSDRRRTISTIKNDEDESYSTLFMMDERVHVQECDGVVHRARGVLELGLAQRSEHLQHDRELPPQPKRQQRRLPADGAPGDRLIA